MRLDLDDLGGEVCLVDFGSGPATVAADAQELPRVALMQGRVTLTLAEETAAVGERAFRRRLVPLEGVAGLEPLPHFPISPLLLACAAASLPCRSHIVWLYFWLGAKLTDPSYPPPRCSHWLL